jgi:hypothetical protein
MTPREFDSALTLTVGQLARLAGIANNRTMVRLLRAGGIQVLRAGRRHVVERLALRAAMPSFYEALTTKLASDGDP